MNFDKVEKLPNSMLKDVTAAPPGLTSLSEEEVLSDGAHTNVSPLDSGQKFSDPSTQPGTTKVNVGEMFDGKYAVDMMDALLPSLLVVVFKMLKFTVKKSQVQLTESEKKTLAPIVSNCLKTLNLDFNNPWVALAATVGIIYGSKIIEVAGVAALDKASLKKTIKDATKESIPNPKNEPSAKPNAEDTEKAEVPGHDTVRQHAVHGDPPATGGFKFKEEDIAREMARLRRGRERAIESLTNRYLKSIKKQK